MYGQMVCIPKKFQKNILEELLAGHLGLVKMKPIVGDQVQGNIIPNIHQRFISAEFRESNPDIQHAETAEDISEDLSKELGSSSLPEEPLTDVEVPVESPSSVIVTDS
ncbi:hypothetical protein TNCT_499161 [Trichonephila clavata]|uniref:Uncharacterized protein n=1 Tax=Trichonephila clavata TaxID=2740835 RepID=A0A8X6LQA6_TRICU|nr:hypothetical protein TNCT_499161 [Trichonephila clavata]